MELTRRSALKGGAGILVGASIAGCATIDADGDGFESGYAAFFTLWDWAGHVTGDHEDFENPVDVGQMGHGWNPDSGLVRDIASTDAFVYLDSPEFSWAQNIASTLEADAPDVAVIDGLDGLEDDLLAWDNGHDHDDHDDDHDHDDHDHDDHDDDHDHDDHDDDHDHDDHDDDHDHDDHDDDHDHDDHDDVFYDPHVWVDPVLASGIVGNIADGLSEIDPDNADTYAENAGEYADRLDEIDEAFEDLVAEADREVAVLAGHDSFGYLEERYGFDLYTPVGVSPDDEASPSEIADTIEFVDENGIDVILYDRFESPRLAEQIVEHSDATEALAVTPAEGTTSEWNDRGWGYLEQMEELNLPAFRRALGAD